MLLIYNNCGKGVTKILYSDSPKLVVTIFNTFIKEILSKNS